MYAIIEACGKQYKVEEGEVVFFEKLDVEEGKKVTFDNVILVSDEKDVQIGSPYVKGAKVEGKVVAHGKGKKIIVFKMKAKKNERTKQGHRQPYTKVENTKSKTAAEKATAPKEEKVVEKTEKVATTKSAAKTTTAKKPATKKTETK